MVKRLLIVFLALLICAPIVDARKKKEKSGKIKKGVFTDSKYGYKLTIPENWDGELQKKNSDFRLILNQKDHKIPPALMTTPKLARVPMIEVYYCEVPFVALEFIDSLSSDSYSSGDKKKIMREILALDELVVFDGLKTNRRKAFKVDELEGGRWEGTANFTVKQGTFDSAKRSYSVGFVTVKNGGQMLSFTITCEGNFFPEIMKEAMSIIESLKWPKAEK